MQAGSVMEMQTVVPEAASARPINAAILSAVPTLPRPWAVAGVHETRPFAALRSEWSDLLAESEAGLFNAWEWLYPWQRRLGASVSPRVMLVRGERDALVGLLPAGFSQVRAGLRRLRRFGFLGETHVGSDYLGPIARRGEERSVAQALAVALRDARREWDVLDFQDLEEGAPFVSALQEAFDDPRWRVEVRPRYVCPYERFETGETFDAFLRRTARRDNYLRRRKWLEKQPGFSIACARSPRELAEPLAEFFRLHAMRWEGDGGSQGIKGPGVEAFHRDALVLMGERGRARLYTMRVGGIAVASVYGLRHRDRFLYFQSGFDPAWRDKSVGLVLVGETFRDAMAEGCLEYDFLRGTEAYKSDWVSKQRQTVAVRVYARRGRGAWLSRSEAAGKRLRNAMKGMMPGAWVEKVRRMRRRRARV